MSEMKIGAKKEYLRIKVLEIGLLALVISLIIISVHAILTPGFVVMSYITPPYIPYFEILIGLTGLTCGTMVWRWYRIPPELETDLGSYFNELGYTTKKGLFHTLKVQKSDALFFKIKIKLHQRASGESCLFNLESMHLPSVLQNPDRFKQIAERFFLNPNTTKQKFSTSCELEEVHLRGLLMTQALEQYLN